jgi:hypothetical protein
MVNFHAALGVVYVAHPAVAAHRYARTILGSLGFTA